MSKQAAQNTTNQITEGVIWKQLLIFFFPILFGTFFQQLYNTADAIIVGNFVGKEALASVGGSASTIINLLVGFFVGLSSGATVIISQYYGADNRRRVSDSVHTAIALAIAGGIVIMLLGLVSARFALTAMGTPDDILSLSLTYMKIYYLGTIPSMIYNMGSGILRAVGDSRRPFYFLLVSAVLNTGLDLLFVLKFGMGVEGVAYATIIAQAVSAALTIWVLMRTAGCIRVELRALRMTWSVLRQIVSVGIPAALQMAITAFSNVFVQGYINYFGPDCMSGWTAYTKVDQLVILPVQSIAMAGTTFVGQNLGVGDTARAKKGVRTALYLSFAVTAVLLVPVLLLAPDLTAFFNSKAEVVSYGALLLRLLSPFYFFFCINQIYSAALRGAGNSQVPMWIMLGSFVVFRQIYLYIVANYVSNEIIPIAMSYPAGWFVCSVATLIYYRFCKFDSHRLVEDV